MRVYGSGGPVQITLTAALACMLAVSTSLSADSQKNEAIQLNSKNPHYFEFRGKTVTLITSGEHYGAVLNADFDYKKYLAALAADGLNYTRIFGGAYVEVPRKSFGIQRNDLAPGAGRFLAPWKRSEAPGYAGGGNKFDLTQWNQAYFDRYKDFLAEAGRRGIVVEISLFSSHYGEEQWNVSPLNRGNNINETDTIDWKKAETLENGNLLKFQEAYVRKLVREAQRFDNVIFEVQNEPWSDRPKYTEVVNPYLPQPARDQFPNSIEVADELSLAWQQRVADWITEEEAKLSNKHLIAQCHSNFRGIVRSLAMQVSVVNFHYAYPEAVTQNYELGKAISYDETGFLGRDDSVYLRQAWNFMLSGGSAFDALDYSFSVGHEGGDDTEPNGPGGGSPSLRHQLRVLARFLAQFDLGGMRRDQSALGVTTAERASALSNAGREFAIYLDGNRPADLAVTLAAGGYSATWIDVKTGATEAMQDFHSTGGSTVLHSPTFMDGIALRIVRKD
ncbi:MAG: hypothetical protein NVS9B14_08900 [Candidatus Acidiferrum sp.]